MPVPVPQIFQYDYVPETKEDLDWADLATIDLSKFNNPEGRKELTQTLLEAIRTKGFFYVINFGIPQEKVDRQYALGSNFYDLSLEEKSKYIPDLDNGEYNGYRPAGRNVLGGGIRDRIEVYNIPKFDGYHKRDHPDVIKQNIGEIEEFARSLHTNVLDPLHVLIALALELPEDYFTNLHRYSNPSEDHLRYMMYRHFSPQETKTIQSNDGLYTLGHTDLGTLTLLFRQPVAALQIRDHETGNWKWAKPLDGSLTVNTCDALSFLTGGYIKSTVHRVSIPPKDQQQYDRLGLLYFARPQNDLPLATIGSPLLKREGFDKNEFERGGYKVPTMGEFVQLKQKWQQTKRTTHREGDGSQILPGFEGKYHD
ncbi:flavonol synthase [Cryptococcus neoformans C23]|uniref:Flavonol synthase n=1 Tax=Cryptococcus neoformans (strain H99 / ATCC 208821 / CBS 10515 / FGSC 9487) TaxID=235443 RepID=J9VXX6_CRYN9|nr:flavonol synthase [Cryptococcus neoformans var. grubii H99]AUB26495.1 flavonol synthase [Cryptococcus neoformans var. grubii]OWZ29654.1 flavonol synthase [Cryptococcus neoformans var. grubii AD2-60a]OWZ41525.1 flavonol synthase [Cryptococcus neoformans var. grubii C23]OWZ52531.1 flavonol synthase [Cryptococcus neoformans var. grubii 125.91]AFR96560.1 flavonol synthase [Cryptococcus neoformans var. grubii H99]|eukprot:XP_012051191.1 flavonol synthase [Cryptococcus neoformans var. grubii H99]